jgi:hypothetical protein
MQPLQPRRLSLDYIHTLQPNLAGYATLLNAAFLRISVNSTSVEWGHREIHTLCTTYTITQERVRTIFTNKYVTVIATATGDQLADDDCWTCFSDLVKCELHVPELSTTSIAVADRTDSWRIVVASSDWRTATGKHSTSSFWDIYTKDSRKQEAHNLLVRTLETHSQQWEHLYHVAMLGHSHMAMYLQSTRLLAVSSDEADIEKTIFDELELGSLLGRGGFGSVYRALWKNQVVAAKIVDGSDITAEVEIGLQLDHPNVIKTLATAKRSVDISTVQTVILLELCDRGSLRSFVESKQHQFSDGTVDTELVHKLLVDIVQGLKHLHERNIIHGDLSMNNVLLSSSLKAKISDFGLSRIYQGATLKTLSHGIITHMAPEVLMSGLVSFAGDVYSVGVITCEMYTQGPLYAPMTHMQLLSMKTHENPVDLIPVQMPTQLKDIMRECLCPDYHKRMLLGTLLEKLLDLDESKTVGNSGLCGE